MRGALRPLIIALALMMTAAVSALAADTGTVSGIVLDAMGQPIADATVTVSGDRLPVGRTATTGANGIYQFDYLLPGSYTLQIAKAGIGTSTRMAVVEVGRDTQVDVVLGVAVSESVTVTAVTPVVDVRSSEVSFNVKAETFATLPLERSYRGLIQLMPGVAENRSNVGPAAGGSRQDNTYLIDGANITNPGFGFLSSEINELDIAEVNLKRAGISAEFGRAAGAVTNAVSRSGSNRFEGLGRVEWLPEQLVDAYALPESLTNLGVRPGAFRDPLLTTETNVAAGVGGPLIADRVFFYGSARYFRKTKWERVNKVGTPLLDEVRRGRELYGKLTATPSAQHQLTVNFRHRPSTVDDNGVNSDYAPTVAVNTDNGSGIGTAEWAYFINARQSLNVRYLYLSETNEDVPVRDLGYQPAFNPTRLADMGQYTDPAQANLIVGANQYANTQNYRRHELRSTFSQFLDVGRTRHALKAGVGYEFGEEEFNRLANGWGIIVNVVQSGVPALRARYYTPQSAQFGQGHTYSLFVQDNVTIGARTSINAGVLVNRDEFAQTLERSNGCPATTVLPKGGAAVYESNGDTCTFLRFGFGDEIQPRLGVSYQLRDGAADKAYANWGRYFNMDQKSSGRSLAPNRIFQTETFFDLNGNALSTGPLASTTGKGIDPTIKPIYSDEFLVGYATPVSNTFSLDVFFMTREMHNFIEDLPSRRNGTAQTSGPFVAANLPCTSFAACQNADAKRSYRAATIDLRRRLANRWMADISYTWSRFEGNFDVDYSTVSVFNTSSFIQDGPGTYVEDPNRFGPLFEDRPHVVKMFGSFAATPQLTVSGYLRVQSGTPWAARGRDWAGAVLNYLEPAGSHRNPTWTNLDLMGLYQIPMQGRARISLEARLLNVFGNQTQLATDAQQFLDIRQIPTAPFFDQYLQPNPFFGTGSSFAPPRRLLLAASISY
jgi:hypothetical protein